MRQYFQRKSLQTQLIALTLLCVSGTATVAWAITFTIPTNEQSQLFRLRMLAGLAICGMACLAALYTFIHRLLKPLHRLREAMHSVADNRFDSSVLLPQSASSDVLGLKTTFDRMVSQLAQSKSAHDESKSVLKNRTRTVDRLLEFSQNIQGAGRADQIFATLGHFLQSEMGLAGLTILSVEPDTVPATTVRACYPLDLVLPDRPLGEMETSLCPCLRQHLPRHFRADGSPVRCTIDSCLKMTDANPAYCIPFTMGGKIQCVVHMLLSTEHDWTEPAKQLAQTYVNTAQSALISLHLLNEAEKQSMTDGLTGLYNRRSLDSLMQREVALAERHHTALSLVMIDMDKFKEINDSYGHAAGDYLLKTFADCVRITLRKTDLAFRYGGDEFVIALPQTPIGQAQQVVQKLRQAFNAVDFSSAITRLDQQPTLSVGVAERSADNNVLTLASMLTAVDQALYDAKNSNRNCVKIYQPTKAA